MALANMNHPLTRALTTYVIALLGSVLLMCSYAGEAHAQSIAQTPMIQFCNQQRTSHPGAFARPLIECFTDADQGIIPTVTYSFLGAVQAYYVPLTKLLFTVAILFFGFKLINGQVRDLRGETFKLIFKIAGILFFLEQAPAIYDNIIGAMQGLNDIISNASIALNNKSVCNVPPPTGSTTYVAGDLWQRWDCIIGILLVAGGTVGYGALLMMLASTKGLGLVIAVIALYLIVALIFALARFLHCYLMGVLGFSFMFCFGYLFVPLLLFRGTADYFVKWLNVCLAYVLGPIIMLGFMGVMMVAMDISIFSGSYSIFQQMAPGFNAASIASNNPLAKLTQPSTGWQMGTFTSFFHIGLGNTANDTTGTCASTATGTSATQQSGGVLGNMNNAGTLASCFEDQLHPSMSNVGLQRKALNIAAIIASAGGGGAGAVVTPAQITQWTVDELLAFSTAALLAYIMYSLIGYIPNLAGDLVSQGGTGVTASLAQSRVFGEDAVRGALEMAQQAAAAQASGGISALAKAGKMGQIKSSISRMVTKGR